jgi:hypothetical protein
MDSIKIEQTVDKFDMLRTTSCEYWGYMEGEWIGRIFTNGFFCDWYFWRWLFKAFLAWRLIEIPKNLNLKIQFSRLSLVDPTIPMGLFPEPFGGSQPNFACLL